jgi:peptidoglycan/LPS O-acetylase OafA/YrhL
MKSTVTDNNFDIIRLFAAAQVAISHTAKHLNIKLPAVFSILEYFPGVPIFFFISGYLIYQSFSNIKEKKLGTFFVNRLLRLYPALFFCFFVTLLSLFISGYLETQSYTSKDFFTWVFTSLTFFQFYNPEFLRSYGVGAINGSLWTISVELQFYILTPLLFFLYTRYKKISISIGFIFVLVNLANTFLNNKDSIAEKLIIVSFVPWFCMFMLGAYISTNKNLQEKILTVNPLVYLLLYLATYFFASEYNLGTGNNINFISYVLLCLLIFRLAYTNPSLSNQVLSGNDISYGIYIYHMPVVNLWLFLKIGGTTISFFTAILCTICMAFISWYLIEKPALKFKKIALRSYT